MQRRLAIYVGPMFAGKTEAALAEARKASVARRSVLYARPAAASRGDEKRVVSHAETVARGLVPTLVESGQEDSFLSLAEGYDVIIVDEGQFFPTRVAHLLVRLFLAGKVVIYCGLDLDFLGVPFETSAALMAVPEAELHRLTAMCTRCNDASATRSLKLVDGAPAPVTSTRYETGGSDLYHAVCLDCFVSAYKGLPVR